MKRTLFALLMTFLVCDIPADVLILKDGSLIVGTVERSDEKGVAFHRDSGTYTYVKGTFRAMYESTDRPKKLGAGVVPDLTDIILLFSKQSWSTPARQIPATVIDKGILRNVPYFSFRCAYDYEVNIYGDPNHPAGFEIGIHKSLLSKEAAKTNCLEFILSLLPGEAERNTLLSLGFREGTATTNGLTFEITPPTAEDAYGGWWVSAYDEKRLDFSRASDQEVQQISVPKSSSTTPRADVQKNAEWSAEEVKLSRPAQAYQAGFASTGVSGAGRVYVHSYVRKDGTYVHAHTRSSPYRR